MVEPVTVVAAATRAVNPVVSGSRLALRKLRQFGTFDLRWLEVNGSVGMTAKEIRALEQFLDDRETRALLSVLAATLLMPENDIRSDSIKTVRRFFMNHAQRYWAENPSGWYNRREEVWETVAQIYDRATPAGVDLAEAAVEFEDFLRTPIDRTRGSDNPGSTNVRYIERMSELCSDIRRVVDASDLAQAMKSALADVPAPPIITYRSTSNSPTFGDLYVDRSLVKADDTMMLSGMALGKQGPPYRAVVHGAPGAGKSTFVKHLRRELAQDVDSQPALLVTVRSYFPAANGQSIVEYISADVRASLSVENDPSQAEGCSNPGAGDRHLRWVG